VGQPAKSEPSPESEPVSVKVATTATVGTPAVAVTGSPVAVRDEVGAVITVAVLVALTVSPSSLVMVTLMV
jgi:hypothetical protein